MAEQQSVVNLYPLTPAQLAEAVKNAGFLGYRGSDFSHDLRCEYVGMRSDTLQWRACYTYRYFNDNEDQWETGRLYVQVNPEDCTLVADW